MNKYNGLLSSVAHKYHICKGARETENEWKTRLVYSICGMMAYASLWDDSEEGTISIVHLKRKVRSMLANYKSMYPELSGSLPYVSEELEDEIADQFLSTGVVYHRPNRIVPSMKHEEPFGDILFQRGIALDSISCVSGIGFYSKQYGAKNTDKIKAMFGLDQENLQTLWRITLSAASWKSDLSFEQNTVPSLKTALLSRVLGKQAGYDWYCFDSSNRNERFTVILSLPLLWHHDGSLPTPTVAGRVLQLQIACMCLSLNLWNIAANRVFRGWSISSYTYELFTPTT